MVTKGGNPRTLKERGEIRMIYVLAVLWVVMTLALMVALGWGKEFVTRKLRGDIVVVERIPDVVVDIVKMSSSVVLAVMLVIGYYIAVKNSVVVVGAIDSTMPRDSSAGWSFFITILLFIAIIGVMGMVIYFHKMAMELAYDEACRAHEKVMETEINWYLEIEEEES